MIRRGILCIAGLLVPLSGHAAPVASSSFEQVVRMSDRIVVGTVETVGAGLARAEGSNEIVLGTKDPTTGLVFTPYRILVNTCLFDKDDSCTSGELEVLIPGGTVYENVDGRQRLRTWEVSGAAGAPLPPPGNDVLLFLTKRNGKYQPLNDASARLRVDRSSDQASVSLRFDSPRFLSDGVLESSRGRLAAETPAMSPPLFTESVEIERLPALIKLARQVLKPTSGIGHAIPDRVAVCDARRIRRGHTCLRTG